MGLSLRIQFFHWHGCLDTKIGSTRPVIASFLSRVDTAHRSRANARHHNTIFPVTASEAWQSIAPSQPLSSNENSRNSKLDCHADARSDEGSSCNA